MTSAPRYRPALDGLRGLAVLAIIAFHTGVPGVQGGWLGVDLFFVLSGFLICSILLRQRLSDPPVPLRAFWAARARRLLPALAIVLGVVVAAGSTLTPPSMRPVLRDDVLATLGYVSNWRFISGHEAYFGAIANPSPLRHTWSLAVEEQFYLLFPLALLLLLRLVGRRWRLMTALGAGAVGSSLLMAARYDAGRHLDRVYYGTDTHAAGLLVGATLAVLLSPATRVLTRDGRARVEQVMSYLALPCLVVVVAALAWGDEASTAFYRGGLLSFSLVAVVVVVAAAADGPSTTQRLLALEPLRRVGVISYGLYLWHWPVIVYFERHRLGMNGWPLWTAEVVLTFALAGASYALVERRVRRDGFGALLPGRRQRSIATAALALPSLVVACALMPLSTVDLTPHRSNVAFHGSSYTGGTRDVQAVLVGNSVPEGLANFYPAARYRDLTVTKSTNVGCDLIGTAKVLSGQVMPVSDDCQQFEDHWTDPVAAIRPDVVVYFVTQSLLDDLRLDDRTVPRGAPEHWRYIDRRLSHMRAVAIAAGARRFAVVTLACHRFSLIGPETGRMNNDRYVRDLDRHVADWARRHHTAVLDQYARLCTGGYHDAIDGVTLYDDEMHFTSRSAGIFWSWLAPAILHVAGRQTG